jgi:type I restriction enzyme, S subunit
MKHEALTEFCDLNMGQSPDSKTYNEQGDGMPFYQGNADFGEIHPETRVWCSKPVKVANEGDILISVRAPIGAMNIATETCCIGRGLAALTPKTNKCSQKYLYYALESKIDVLVSKGTGSTFKAISKKVLAETLVPSYNDEKQQQITDTLSKIDVLITDRKQQLIEMDLLVKSRFIELFGDLADPKCRWTKEKIVDACKNPDDIKCGPFGTQLSKDEYCDSGIAVWEIPQINSGFATQPTHFLTAEKANQLEAYSIKSGDIAMSRKGNVGRCAVFPDTMEDGIIHSDVLRIRVNNELVLPVFMMHQLHYSRAVQHQIELVSSGAIMAGINVTKLKQIEVHIPPMELQKQFANFVAQVDKSKHFGELEVAA